MIRRTKIIILISACAIFIFLVAWLVLAPQIPIIIGNENINTNTTELPTASNTNTASTNTTIREPEANASVQTRSLASIFSERYGSFSNQSDYKNLTDLDPMLTPKFSLKNSEYIKKMRAQNNNNDEYFGITSKTMNNKLISINKEETQAQVKLTLQRREALGSISDNVRVYYQDIDVYLKKIDNEWKIDDAQWK